MVTGGEADGRPELIQKQSGVTAAERRLSHLCHRSFLSLWSYPGVFRDQGAREGKQEGKEICDLLVVFGNDVIIFSDKDCAFPDGQTLDVSWSRWFRRAVLKSAEQAWGAERWLRRFPDRVFLDRKCERRFPVSLPDAKDVRFHRVVVAHSAAAICKDILGGTGSLMICPRLKVKDHFEIAADKAGPVDHADALRKGFRREVQYEGKLLLFMIGDVDPTQGFVHVFDDSSLDMVMSCLDTASDFVTYLRKKEAVIRGGRLLFAAGEDDLLAYYLQQTNGQGEHDFNFPTDGNDRIVIPEGEWELLRADLEWESREDANRVSRLWDDLIERFNKHILDGTSLAYPSAPFDTQELAVRALARENRFHRRLLSLALGEFARKPHSMDIAARVVKSMRNNGPHYVFISVRPGMVRPEDDYRQVRQKIAIFYSLAVEARYPEANEAIVIAIEPHGWGGGYSQDVVYKNMNDLTPAELEDGKWAHRTCGFLAKLGDEIEAKAYEYPLQAVRAATSQHQSTAGRGKSARNSLCPCGSMKKAKRCCLR